MDAPKSYSPSKNMGKKAPTLTHNTATNAAASPTARRAAQMAKPVGKVQRINRNDKKVAGFD